MAIYRFALTARKLLIIPPFLTAVAALGLIQHERNNGDNQQFIRRERDGVLLLSITAVCWRSFVDALGSLMRRSNQGSDEQ